MHILIAEDEQKVADSLVHGLKAEGYSVDLATNGDDAFRMASTSPYDALVLDVTMPGKDGYTVVQLLRKQNVTTPVIFVTARDGLQDRVQGLDAGGDDYLVKPFFITELLARLRAVLRRGRGPTSNTLHVGDLELDLVTRKAKRGEEVELTNREFALLEFLMSNSPKPVSKAAIVEHVWGQQFYSQTNVVNVYINHLRKKVDRPGMRPLLHTVRGLGFVLAEHLP